MNIDVDVMDIDIDLDPYIYIHICRYGQRPGDRYRYRNGYRYNIINFPGFLTWSFRERLKC